MAWNKPGGDGDNPDPWGGGKKNQGPPDIDKLISEFFNKLKGFKLNSKGPGQPSPQKSVSPKEYGLGLGLISALIAAAWFLSGFYIVNPAEQTVILRLGQYSDVEDPGLHWMARFIDTKYTVDTQKINSFSLQDDFITKSSEQGDLPNLVAVTTTDANPTSDTSDKSKNLVSVEMTVQYRVSDPRAYLFSVVDPDTTIKEVASGALSDVVGKMKLDDVLTTGRELLSSGVLERTKQILLSYKLGLQVVAVTLRSVQAPEQVQAAFNDVNRADQDKATYIQQAQAYASKVVPLAQGVAARISADATAYQQQTMLNAQAQVAKFNALLSVYQTSPDLTRERMYLETLQSIFEHTSKVLVDSNVGNNMLYLPLDKVMATIKQEDAAPENSANSTLLATQAGSASSNAEVK
jgi:membrane protease subunit HflK